MKVLVVRNRDHVPATPTDGTVLTHGTGALNDTGLQVDEHVPLQPVHGDQRIRQRRRG